MAGAAARLRESAGLRLLLLSQGMARPALISLLLMAGGAAGAAVFRAGAARTDISPSHFPVLVNAMFTERVATQTVDRLHARALVLDDGATRIALAVVDTCMMPRDLIDRAKALTEAKTGIPAARMLISATHTHSAPSAMGCLGSRVDPEYAAYLPGRIAQAIADANAQLAPAQIGWVTLEDWDHTFNRRWIRRPDRLMKDPFGEPTVRAHMHPGHQSPDVIGPSGPVDPGLSVVAARSVDGEPIAVLANYSQHYYGSPLLSSDYYGRFAGHLARLLRESGLPGSANREFVAIMSQGTSGDLMWMDYAAPRREAGYDAYALEMASRVSKAYREIQFKEWVPLRMSERKLPLAYRVPDAARLAWARQMASQLDDRLPQSLPEIYALEAIHLHERKETELVLQALRIGELGIAAMPNEVFALTGLRVKAWSPLEPTFTIGLANGAEGYIPPPEQHRLGGYTTWPARTAGLEVSAEPRIVEATLQLLEEVSGRPRRRSPGATSPYAKAVLKSAPISYWRLDDMTYAPAEDSSGHGRQARFEGGVALFLPGVGSGEGTSPRAELTSSPFASPGSINRAVHLAGGHLLATLPGLTDTYSVEFWFWNGLSVTNRGVTAWLFSRTGNGEESRDRLGIGGTNGIAPAGGLFFLNGSETPSVGETPLTERAWHHVVLTRDGSRVSMFLDGRPETGLSATTAGESNGSNLFFGAAADTWTLEGRLDEVAVYDRVLPPGEARAHFAAGTPENAAGRASDLEPRSPAESLAGIHVTAGFHAELVAAEPLIADPVAIDWGIDGRLWVIEMADYPMGMDGKGQPGGRVRVLEDVDNDGDYDLSGIFADGLNFPNGILTWRDGVLVTAAPEVLFLRDTDGDGVADERRVLLTGFLEGNQQLRVNGLRWGLDGWVYCAAGGHHRGHGAATRIRSVLTGAEVPLGSRDFRFRPDTGEIDPQSGPTQFGRNRDDWGHWFGTQNSWPLWHYVLPDEYLRRNPHVASPDPVRQVIQPMNPRVFPVSRSEKRYHSFEHAGHFTSACGGMVYRDNLLFSGDGEMMAFACEPFHNLVHREVLRDQGVSFSASRAPEERASDFFASDDGWCRPVMVRTGPDGALWIVDMYRYMIEHPDWLPANGREELLPHYRKGEDRGRVYRILPDGVPARRPPVLGRMTAAQWCEVLASPNGWLRDKAHQLLLWHRDQSVIADLKQIARSHSSAHARLHALWILDAFEALEDERIEAALADRHPGVRENALRLAETRESEAVIRSALPLVKDPSPKVRLQLAFSLGQWRDPRAARALGELLEGSDDPFLLAAVLSSAVPHRETLADIALGGHADLQDRLIPPLIEICVALGDRDLLARLLAPTLTRGPARFVVKQMRDLDGFLRLLAARRLTVGSLAGAGSADRLDVLLAQRERMFEAALESALDRNSPAGERISAAGLLMHDESRRDTAIRSLSAWLRPQVPAEDQDAAIRALASTGHRNVAAALLARWNQLGPAIRSIVLDTLSGREAWAVQLLQATDRGDVSRHAFHPAQRARLLQHASGSVRGLAKKVFEASEQPSRTLVIEDYRPALDLVGDPNRGAVIYEDLCSACHQRGGSDTGAGPDLNSVASHAAEKLLVSIVDPNADVQPGYHAYHCTLVNGEELYGVIAAETGTTVVLRLTDGSARTVRNAEIAELRGASVSLMPEGLEAGRTHQDLADLIRYLQTPTEPGSGQR
jgi:putative membrane-bound dehydrogenase-like protein